MTRPLRSCLAGRFVARAMMTVMLIAFAERIHAAEAQPPIDPIRGRRLMEKSSRGETLTPEEMAYLDRVRQAIRERAAGRRPGSPPSASVSRSLAVNPNDWSALVPMTDMTSPYQGEDGGLYGGGQNEPPEAHRAAHLQESENGSSGKFVPGPIIPRDSVHPNHSPGNEKLRC